MLRIAGRTAVAASENLSSVLETAGHQLAGFGQRAGEHRNGFQFQLGALGEVLINSLDQVHFSDKHVTVGADYCTKACLKCTETYSSNAFFIHSIHMSLFSNTTSKRHFGIWPIEPM